MLEQGFAQWKHESYIVLVLTLFAALQLYTQVGDLHTLLLKHYMESIEQMVGNDGLLTLG